MRTIRKAVFITAVRPTTTYRLWRSFLSGDKKKNSGTLLPACQFKIDKKNQLEIEAHQNPWKLVNITRR